MNEGAGVKDRLAASRRTEHESGNNMAHALALALVSPNFTWTTMVQGKTKGLQPNSKNPTRNAARAAAPKKGQRAIAPKKTNLIKQAAVRKVGSAACGFLGNCSLFISELDGKN